MRAFVVAAVLLFPSLASAQMVSLPAADTRQEDPTESIGIRQLAGLYGITVCHAGRGIAFVQMGLSRIEEANTRAHEQKHVEQYTRYASCKEFLNYYRTPAGMLVLEAEAYAAGDCVAQHMGADPVSLLQLSAQKIEYTLGGGTSRLVVIQELQKYRCQSGSRS